MAAPAKQGRSVGTVARLSVAALVVAAVGVVVLHATAPAAAPPTLAYWLVNDDAGVLAQRVRRQTVLVEHVVADCMAKLGLRYIPQVPRALRPDANLPPRDFVAKYGFGVTTQLSPPAEEEPDTNLAYLDSLGPGEGNAYRMALFGNASEPGCREEATRRVIAPREEAIASADALVSELASRRSNDPRIKEAERAWQDCARSAGLPTTRQEAGAVAQSILAARLQAIRLADGTYEPSKLALLQAEERTLALALFECDTSYNQVARVATNEVAAAWGRDHATVLAALRQRLIDFDHDLAGMAREFGIER